MYMYDVYVVNIILTREWLVHRFVGEKRHILFQVSSMRKFGQFKQVWKSVEETSDLV